VRRVLAAFVFVWVTLVASIAPAAEIERYRVDVRESEHRDDAIDVRMELVYRASVNENKRDGFKYIGRQGASNVRVTAPDGTPLRFQLSREGRSGEWRLDFDLSSPISTDAYHETRAAIITFTQPVSEQHRWASERVELRWPAQFRLPVLQTEYRSSGSWVLSGDNCSSEGEATVCRPSSPSTMRLERERGPTHALVGVSLGLLTAVALLLRALRSRFAAHLSTKGVLPPAPAHSYSVAALLEPGVFRAPPPLPTPAELPEPVLPESERRAWESQVRTTVLIAFIAPMIAAFALSTFGSEIDPGVLLFVAFVAGALSSLWLNSDAKPRVWPSVVVSAALLGPIGLGLVGAVGSIIGGGLVLAIGKSIADAPAGSFNSGGSSCSSGSSSCGGGGGGCGGGGCGGGGCGG